MRVIAVEHDLTPRHLPSRRPDVDEDPENRVDSFREPHESHFARPVRHKTSMRNSKFIEFETLERKVERLVKSYAPNATPSEVDLFRPLLTRLAILEEQNASDRAISYLSNGS